MLVGVLGFAGLALAATTAAQAPGCDPTATFARVRGAMGGPSWSSVAETVAKGTVTSSGLSGPTKIAVDVHNGRSALYDDIALQPYALVFDGTTTWQMDSSLGVHPLDAPDARAAATSDAWLRRNAFFAPAASGATFACQGTRTEGDRQFDVVRMTPQGGRPITVWIDRRSSLVDRSVQRTPTLLMTTTYRDYRRVGGIVVPFEIVESDGTASGTTVRRFRSYDVLASASDADFRRPRDPTNQRMLGDAAETTVPFTLENGETIVEATIDGRGPLPFLLDSGGHAIVTEEAAKALGLQPEGQGASGGGGEGRIAQQYAQTRSLRIGAAEIDDIPFLVIPYGRDFTDRGPGKPPLAGILGLEIFERFAVRFDFGRKRLTLTPLASFRYSGPGVRRRLVFQEDIPLTKASADGFPGLFEVDTGNGGSTILIGDYLKHHGFFARYKNGVAGASMGSGGIVHNTTLRLRTLTFGDYDFENFIANFVVQNKGTFSSRTEAGNVGFDILSQFTPTFDYRSGSLYLERRADAPVPIYTRVGFGVTIEKGGMQVATVLAHSPAGDAGLATGDRIVSIDGIPASAIDRNRFRELARGPVGSTMRLSLAQAAGTRGVALRLRELLCADASSCTPAVKPHAGVSDAKAAIRR